MNNFIYILLISLLAFSSVSSTEKIYDISVEDHEGREISLEKYKGKVTFIVNVASHCGYTDGTYKALTRLHDILSFGNHFSVLAFPCNQFGEQEPDDASEVASAMQEAYGVEFPIFNKIDVIGREASPLFRALIEQSGVVPDWNFYKYLVDGEGQVLNAWGTATTIEDIFDEIQEAVEKNKKKGSHSEKEKNTPEAEKDGKESKEEL